VTTLVAETALAWDHFLPKEVDETLARGIEAFRTVNWLNIKRELAPTQNQHVADGVEPHWTAPGEAMFWQRTTLRHRGDDGNIEETLTEWEPTGPISAGSAAVIARHLENGMRLRPEGGVEAQDAAGPPVDQVVPETYTCVRHNAPYPTWRGYLKHCKARYEIPELPLPMDRWRLVRSSIWYCRWHDTAWGAVQRRSVLQHQRSHKLGPVLVHATLESLETGNQKIPSESRNGGK